MKIVYFCPDCGGSAEILSHRRKPKYKALVCEKCGLRTAFYDDLASAPVPKQWRHYVETCPFCDSKPRVYKSTSGFTIGCGNADCSCFPQTIPYPSIEEAIHHWNRSF